MSTSTSHILQAALKTNDASRNLATALALGDLGTVEMAKEALREALSALEKVQASLPVRSAECPDCGSITPGYGCARCCPTAAE